MKILRWGLIGCGDIANRRVAPALKLIPNCDLIAIARLHYKLTSNFANKFGVNKCYKDWHDLIRDKDVDAVYIATPHNLHASMTIFAVESRKHVLCEKPMALNVRECEEMIDASKKNNVFLGIAYYRRFYPIIIRIKEILNSGGIGDPIIAKINAFEWFDLEPGDAHMWILNPAKAGGGPMKGFGCHRIEVLLNIFGEVSKITSHLSNLHFKREVEDTAFVGLEFKCKVLGLITVTHAAYEKQDTLDIFGTKGSIHVPVLNKDLLIVKTDKEERKESHPNVENAHIPLIKNFTESVLNGREPIVNGQVGIEVCKIEDEIYEKFD